MSASWFIRVKQQCCLYLVIHMSCYSLLLQSTEADTLWRSYLAMASVRSCSTTSKRCSGWTWRRNDNANDTKVTGWFLISTTCLFRRFSCVPVDFEVVHVNSALETDDDMNNAIMAIRRNGVALKGKKSPLLHVFYWKQCAEIHQVEMWI